MYLFWVYTRETISTGFFFIKINIYSPCLKKNIKIQVLRIKKNDMKGMEG